MRRAYFSLILLGLIGSLGYYFFRPNTPVTNDSVLNDSKFIVGTAGGYAPFVSLNESGQYEGFDIDVAQALAQRMGKALKIKDLGSMGPLFVALDQGSIDAIIWGLSIIPERLKTVDMIPYYGDAISSYKLIFWKQIPEGVSSITDLEGKIVCVEVGSAQEKVLSDYGGIIQKPMDKVVDSLMEIRYGKADAAFIEPAVAKKFQEKLADIRMFDVPLKPEDQELGVGIAIKKDNINLKTPLVQAISELKQDGTLEQLEKKWGMS